MMMAFFLLTVPGVPVQQRRSDGWLHNLLLTNGKIIITVVYEIYAKCYSKEKEKKNG